ncbi:branched-chain amino acid transport system II carrier protein [Gallaecimonas kandeliae]|uniref:branched-chain amino acid transport system II carrier protein n=1 Tax=Gallaecimonas kandeliae TaxID=3029055 RepID=UPI0026486466|nr:branched-chain amino acid transport system II carrier protein [Gallaecimonas kandeliae]WKE66373.1 branched-chain amino acid transport system II carrier protein [Gallaecimonas kandeliae]
MTTKLKGADILALGFMTFAFFLGAGNMIFPPLAGLQAAGDLGLATIGFLLTAVGLPLLTIIAVALAGGGLEALARVLPKGLALLLCVALYLILGPFFATPRTALVAYELGFAPFISAPGPLAQALYSLAFFGLTFYLAIRPGKLLAVVGKVITPVLLLLLGAIALTLMVAPPGVAGASVEAWHQAPFAKGFLEGYMTMDTLGALLFGLVIVNALKAKGVEDRRDQFRYLCMAGGIAATGLALVYVTLFHLGADSGSLVSNPKAGSDVLVPAIQALFGAAGLYVLAAVVTLACLTTAVGLTSACAEYFSLTFPRLGHVQVAAVVAAGSALVANVGLAQLIAISVPVLFFVYPVAIALVALRLLAGPVGQQRWGQQLVVAVTAAFALFDGLKAAGVTMPALLSSLPLFDAGMGWLLPASAALVVMALGRNRGQALAEAVEG